MKGPAARKTASQAATKRKNEAAAEAAAE